MNKFVVGIASVAVLSGAYYYSFGVPSALAAFVTTEAPAEASDAAPSPRGPGGREGRGSRATTVVLSPLEEQEYALVLRTIGTAKALRNVDVIARQAGSVVEAQLTANQFVNAGDVLIKLDDRAEQFALEIAKADRDQAQTTVDRYATLGAAGNLTVTNVAVSEAEVALRLSEANVGLAEIALADRIIESPISGQLGLSDIHVGDYLGTSDFIVSIDDSSTIVAEFEVPERSIGLLAVGKPVLVGAPTYAGRVFEGAITGFDAQLDSVTRSATVRATVDNAEGLLLPGMTFNVRMTEELDPMPVVPSTAITWDQDGAGIWISNEGTASRQPITIRYRDGDQVWIETDVPVGADVVVEGAAKLRDGAAITDANAPKGKP